MQELPGDWWLVAGAWGLGNDGRDGTSASDLASGSVAFAGAFAPKH